MKKTILSITALIVCAISFGQNDYRKPASIGVHFFLNDFQTASEVRANGLGNTMTNKQWFRSKRMTPGVALSYFKGVTNKIDFAATASGSFGEYPVPDKSPTLQQKFIFEVAATWNLKLLPDKYCLNPFITGGVGVSNFKRYFSGFIPVGAGMQIKVTDNVFFIANSQYRIPVTENGAYHFYHSLGVVASVKKK